MDSNVHKYEFQTLHQRVDDEIHEFTCPRKRHFLKATKCLTRSIPKYYVHAVMTNPSYLVVMVLVWFYYLVSSYQEVGRNQAKQELK